MHLLRLRWPFVLYACGLVLPAPALPAPPQAPAVAALVKMMHDDRRSQAALVSRLADAELKASDPGLSPADRKSHAEVVALKHGTERSTRKDGMMRAKDYALLKKSGATEQSENDALLEATAYNLPSTLKKHLDFYPDTPGPAVGLAAWVRFGRSLSAFAATLPAEGRRAKLATYLKTELAKLPKDDSVAQNKVLSTSHATAFDALTDIFGDAVAGLEAAENLVRLEGYSGEVHAKHAEVLARCGRRDEALRALDVALALDPKNPRALKWEARLKENAPELFTGVLEEPADKTSLAALGVMALLGQTPKDRSLLAVEAACRTLTRRMLAALRAPAARREVALRQAAALPTQVVGTLIGPAKEAFHSSLGKLDAAKTAADAKAAFAAVPLEAGVHPLYWQARSKEFVLARDHRGHLDCILAALALDPQNAWAKGKRAAVEGLLASASAATSTVATPAKAVPEGPVAVEVRTEFQTETQAAIWAGDFPKAEAAIAAALARNPADAAALIQRARVRLGRFEMPAAEADAKAAVAAGGKTLAEAHGVLATVQFALGKTAEATASGTKALELVPDQPDALLALAQLDSKENRGAPALAKLDRCLAARPGFEEALAAKAGALVQVRKSAEVLPLLQAGLAKNPLSLTLHTLAVGQHMMMSRFDLARQELDAIAKLPHPKAAFVYSTMDPGLKQIEARLGAQKATR